LPSTTALSGSCLHLTVLAKRYKALDLLIGIRFYTFELVFGHSFLRNYIPGGSRLLFFQLILHLSDLFDLLRFKVRRGAIEVSKAWDNDFFFSILAWLLFFHHQIVPSFSRYIHFADFRVTRSILLVQNLGVDDWDYFAFFDGLGVVRLLQYRGFVVFLFLLSLDWLV
jgi:hypothetical protein